MVAIIVVGLARAGKDTFADYLAEKYGMEKFVFSDELARELEKRGAAVTKPAMVKLGDELRKNGGMDFIARLLCKRIEGKDGVVLVGARSPEEIAYVKKCREDVVVVRVDCGKETRFARRSETDPDEFEAFLERDNVDIEKKGLGKTLELAEHVLDNNGSLAEFHEQIEALVEELDGA